MSAKQFLPTLPVRILRSLQQTKTRHIPACLLQAHDMMAHERIASEVTDELNRQKLFWILDNGSCELGHPIGIGELIGTARVYRPTVVVLSLIHI